jgi:hypothetical protein
MKKDDDDDAPTYVMEETNQSMTKEEYDAYVSGKDAKGGEEPDGEVAKEKTTEIDPKPKDRIAEVGANAKKRKAAKVISEEQEQSRESEGKDVKKTGAKVVKKPKKKAKAVKLTFGDEDDLGSVEELGAFG